MATAHTVIETPPEVAYRLPMSYEEFLAYVEEDMHAEWVDGEVMVFMPPKPRHQIMVGFLYGLLKLFVDFFQRGEVLTAPLEMKLTPTGPAREPDILFVAQENMERLTEERVAGPADLVVEVVSEDSVTRDKVQKFTEYQAAGVREYWLVDSRPGEAGTDFYVRDEQGQYREVPIGDDGIYRSTVLPGFYLRVEWLQAEELPEPLRAFAEIVGPSRLVEALQEMAAQKSDAAESRK